MLYALGGLVYLIVFIYMASLMRSIAESKGYDDPRAFWLTLILGAVGILYVIALPDLRARQQREDILTVLLGIREGGR